MKFIHAADIHLDSPLRGLERYEGAPVEAIRGATRRALREPGRPRASTRRSTSSLLAGDLYDGDWKDYNTGLFFARRWRGCREAGIPVFLVRGNHDAASQITRTLRPPQQRARASRRPARDRRCSRPAASPSTARASRTGRSPRTSRRRYPGAASRAASTSACCTPASTAGPGHEPLRALHASSACVASGYDYWALGHVHAREVLCEATRGSCSPATSRAATRARPAPRAARWSPSRTARCAPCERARRRRTSAGAAVRRRRLGTAARTRRRGLRAHRAGAGAALAIGRGAPGRGAAAAVRAPPRCTRGCTAGASAGRNECRASRRRRAATALWLEQVQLAHAARCRRSRRARARRRAGRAAACRSASSRSTMRRAGRAGRGAERSARPGCRSRSATPRTAWIGARPRCSPRRWRT